MLCWAAHPTSHTHSHTHATRTPHPNGKRSQTFQRPWISQSKPPSAVCAYLCISTVQRPLWNCLYLIDSPRPFFFCSSTTTALLPSRRADYRSTLVPDAAAGEGVSLFVTGKRALAKLWRSLSSPGLCLLSSNEPALAVPFFLSPPGLHCGTRTRKLSRVLCFFDPTSCRTLDPIKSTIPPTNYTRSLLSRLRLFFLVAGDSQPRLESAHPPPRRPESQNTPDSCKAA